MYFHYFAELSIECPELFMDISHGLEGKIVTVGSWEAASEGASPRRVVSVANDRAGLAPD